MMVNADSKPVKTSRLLYLDNIRTLLIACVILGHLAMTYGAEGDWYYKEAGQGSDIAFLLFLPLAAVGVAFMMGLFFLIAGYFTPRAYDRKGAGRFLLDRLMRLGIPLLFYEVVINPLINYAINVHSGDFRGSLWQYLPGYVRSRDSFGDGPVWFLEALLIFCVFYALWRLLTRSAPRAETDTRSDSKPPGNGAIALFALGLGVVTFVARIWVTVGVSYEPWHLELARFPQFIAMFVVGIVAYRRNWLATYSDAQARVWRWVALLFVLLLPALAVASGALTGTLDERAAGGLNGLSLAYSVWEAFMGVAMVITVLVWFRRRFNCQGRLARAMSEGTFAAYVLHPGIIIPLALTLSGIRINLGLKFLLVAPVALALCFGVGYCIRRLSLARKIL
jgi:glucan biosynthesis protein C